MKPFFKDIASAENITESLVSEGLVSVRREGGKGVPEVQRLIELEDAARSANKGKWGGSTSVSELHLYPLCRLSVS